MRFRKLRIAFSGICIVACLLVIAAWGQGFGVSIHGYLPGVRSFDITSFCFHRFGDSIWSDTISAYIEFGIHARNDAQWRLDRFSLFMGERPERFRFEFDSHRSDIIVNAPHWFVILLCGAFAIAPWIPVLARTRQFSLRTLLIATALIAVVLTLVVLATGHKAWPN